MEWDNVVKVLTQIGIDSATIYKAKLKKGAYTTGNLYNSVGYRVDATDQGVKLSLSMADYYIYVEEGRKAGSKMPPINVIRKWILARGLPNKPGLEYAISRSIAKHGIKPKPYIREIKLKLKENYADDIEKAFNLDMKEHIANEIKKINQNNVNINKK